MKKSPTDLPAVIPQRSDADADSNSNPTDLLWKKLTTFLSLRAPNTATTYLSIIKEWCLFLGAEAGTPTASNLFLSATDDQAAAYRRWLSNRPGEIPRSKRTKKSPIKNIPITPNTPPSTAALSSAALRPSANAPTATKQHYPTPPSPKNSPPSVVSIV
jgi:hypothetical protein